MCAAVLFSHLAKRSLLGNAVLHKLFRKCVNVQPRRRVRVVCVGGRCCRGGCYQSRQEYVRERSALLEDVDLSQRSAIVYQLHKDFSVYLSRSSSLVSRSSCASSPLAVPVAELPLIATAAVTVAAAIATEATEAARTPLYRSLSKSEVAATSGPHSGIYAVLMTFLLFRDMPVDVDTLDN